MSWIRDEYDYSLLERFAIRVLKCGRIPRHVAFIMDGNRRYAKQNNVKKIEGHSQGFEKLAETLQWCRHLGIDTVTVYAFSIENFKRDKEEVESLFDLFREKIRLLIAEEKKLAEHGVRVKIIGNLSYLPEDIQELIAKAEAITKNNEQALLNVAFSYTAREEITQAVRRAVDMVDRGLIREDEVDEKLLDGLMYTAHCRDPDLLVRTSGETRLSDFLLWQTANCVTYFTEVLWPAFNLWHLLAAVFYYQRNQSILDRLQPDIKQQQVEICPLSLLERDARFAAVLSRIAEGSS